MANRTLGARLEKVKGHPWPTVFWAVIDDARVVAHAVTEAPKTYSEAAGLRHVHEAIESAVRENEVRKALVWTIETNVRLTFAMRPRIRLEGAVAAGIAAGGAKGFLGAWAEVCAGAHVPTSSKDSLAAAKRIGGIDVNGADGHAVLAAIAARGV